MKYLKKLFLLFMAIILLFPSSLVYAGRDNTYDKNNNINQGVKDVTYDDSIEIDNGDNELNGGTTDSNTYYYRTVAGYLAKKHRGENPYVDSKKYPKQGGKHEDALIEAHYDEGKDNYDDAHLLAAARRLGLEPNKEGIAIGYINCIIKVVKAGKAKFYNTYKSAWNAMVDAGVQGNASERFKEERYNRRVEIKYPTLINLDVILNKYENGATSQFEKTLHTQLYTGSSFRIDNVTTTLPEYIDNNQYRLYRVDVYDGKKPIIKERFDIDKGAFLDKEQYAEKLKQFRNILHKVNNSDITFNLYYKKVPKPKYPVTVYLRKGDGSDEGTKIKTKELDERYEKDPIVLDEDIVPNDFIEKSTGKTLKPVYAKIMKDDVLKGETVIKNINAFRNRDRTAYAGHTKIYVYYNNKEITEDIYPVTLHLIKGNGIDDKNEVELESKSLGKKKENTSFKLTTKEVPNTYKNGSKNLKPVYYKVKQGDTLVKNGKGSITKYTTFMDKTYKAYKPSTHIYVYYINGGGGGGSGSGGGSSNGGNISNGSDTSSNNSNTISIDYSKPKGLSGVIKADTRGKELFDVSQGIPTTENEYTCVLGQKYLVKYSLTKTSGKSTYHRSWSEVTGYDEKGNPIMQIRTATDTRYYSYWKVSNLSVYAIDHAEVLNYSFNGNKVVLKPNNYKAPTVKLEESGGIKLKPQGSLNSSKEFTYYKVANDTLIIDGHTILNSEQKKTSTPAPSNIPQPGIINNTVLYQSGLTIPKDKQNGDWKSEGKLVYRRVTGDGAETLEFDVDVNNVVIHTPTVCYAKVQNVKEWNQMIYPNKTKVSLVLDRPFMIKLPTVGQHKNYKNYGYRDYKKYIEKRQVKFPFDVYTKNAKGSYIKANTWITIFVDTPTFYLPPWVHEGDYEINFRTMSINAINQERLERKEHEANLNRQNYVATDVVKVHVSGRVYGFMVYDISDYPLWESVFRQSKGSTKLTNTRYRVGTKNKNGEANNQPSKLTLPLLPGSHPVQKCQGAVPLGYVTRFSLSTMGDMYTDKDYITIKPTFYYVSRDGKRKEEVDLYYNETFYDTDKQYHYLVKVGSERDKKNIKKLKLGDLYTGVPDLEIHQTERILGLQKNHLFGPRVPVYTFGRINIPWRMRTFIGRFPNRPSNVSEQLVRRSIQKWYGEYYLPATVYAVKKDFDVLGWAKKYGKYNGIDFHEPFWKDKYGYITVNFSIETIQNGKRHLSYINPTNVKDGYCNMWKQSGFTYKKKDCKGNIFTFQDGDYAVFDLNRSVKDDYITGGTH